MYYTGHLTKADGERPGVWMGSQAPGLGVSGEVTIEAPEALPKSGTVVSDLRTRWESESARRGIDATTLTDSIGEAARATRPRR